MLDCKPLMIKTWAGEIRGAKKITFFVEKDNKGELFYKIEGQNNTEFFMIQYKREREEAWEIYIKLMNELVDNQEKNLKDL